MAMSEFEKAFAAARKAGKKTFTFKGKSYNTKLKEGSESGSSKSGTTKPKARPKTDTGTRPQKRPTPDLDVGYNPGKKSPFKEQGVGIRRDKLMGEGEYEGAARSPRPKPKPTSRSSQAPATSGRSGARTSNASLEVSKPATKSSITSGPANRGALVTKADTSPGGNGSKPSSGDPKAKPKKYDPNWERAKKLWNKVYGWGDR